MIRFFNVQAVVLISFLSVSACEGETEPTEERWSDGLTRDQVVSAMPIVVSDVQSDATGNNAIGVVSSALTDGEDTLMSLSLTWRLPIYPWNHDATWKVYHKNDDGEWQLTEVDIQVDEVDEEYRYRTTCRVPISSQRIVYFRVEMTDNNGDSYDNIVSFFVYPKDRTLRITLSEETAADAPSKLYIGYREWYDLFADIHELTLPQTKEVEEDLSAWTTVLFKLEADFTVFGFEGDERLVSRQSNSSYCRVELAPPPDDTVESRLRYAFEDLPITRLSSEPTGYFDYNDMVFYVDIMKP